MRQRTALHMQNGVCRFLRIQKESSLFRIEIINGINIFPVALPDISLPFKLCILLLFSPLVTGYLTPGAGSRDKCKHHSKNYSNDNQMIMYMLL